MVRYIFRYMPEIIWVVKPMLDFITSDNYFGKNYGLTIEINPNLLVYLDDIHLIKLSDIIYNHI